MPLTATYRNILQGSHRKATLSLSSAPSRGVASGGKRSLALSLLCGALAVVLAPVARAQAAPAAPQMLPWINTILAGTGTPLVPVSKAGSATTPVHGSEIGDGGAATSAAIVTPTHIAVDSLGDVYFTDDSVNVRKVDTSGNITTFAGGLTTGAGDCATATDNFGDGCAANESYMHSPYGIAIDPASGAIYVGENNSAANRIRRIDPKTYTITAAVNAVGTKGSVDGDLPACSATTGATCSGTAGLLDTPRGIAVDKHGNLYIMDESNYAVRLANFTTGQLTTVVNTAKLKEGGVGVNTCAQNLAAATASGGSTLTAGSLSLGVAGTLAFDSNDNLYISDSSCNFVYKVAEDTGATIPMVDSGSTVTIVLGGGTGTQATFTDQLGTTVSITPGGIVADAQGNLYVGENTGTHVWFWDHATGYMHTVYGGGTSGSCFGVTDTQSYNTSPYNGCDGIHSGLTATHGTLGLALDAWGNLYITDSATAYVHKLSLGTNAPSVTTNSSATSNPNALLHVGATDTYASVATTLAPDFTFAQQSCAVNSSSATPAGDNTQDCGFVVTNTNPLSSAQYEPVTVTTTAGLSSVIPLTNQAYPTCRPATATSQSFQATGAPISVTLSSQPGAACSGVETIVAAPHKYTYAIVANPTNGTVSGTAPNMTYTPNSGYTGSDSFTYSVTDSSTFAPATVSYDSGASTVSMEALTPLVGTTGTITVLPYTPPVATAQSVTVTYNTAQNITLTGTDSNSATLTYAVATQPTHGTLSGTAPNLTYTPTTSYFGADSFTFTVNDGVQTSAAGTIAITVNPPPPTPTNPSVSVNYQTATAVTLGATGQGTITYAVTTQPTNGTLSGTAPNLTYTPTGTYVGTDSFTYTATNAGGGSVGTVSITVQPAPVIPVAQNSSATVAFNTATQITAVAGGGNGHALTYSVVTGPAHGSLSAFTGPVATYTPTSGYIGADSFTFEVTDGTSTSTPATVSITVNQAAPVANSQSVTTAFATPVSVTLVATGPPTITYSVVAAPANGTLSGTAPNLTYTPGSNYAGADSFTFKANNGGDSNIATVSITVTAPPLPVPASQSVTVNYQTATAVTLSATGLGTITYAVSIPPTNGTLSGTVPNLTYTPATGYSGSDSFSFTATNPGGTSVAAVVSLTVLPIPPMASAQTVTDPSNGALPITLVATGTGTMTYTVATQPTHGTVTISGAVATYTPSATNAGTDSFTFTASNGSVSNAAKVSILVLPVAANLAPAPTNFNTPEAITLSATGTGLTFTIVAQPSNGTVSLLGALATYTPAATFTGGSDSFTYTATNAGGTGNVATVTIIVNDGFIWSPASSGGALSATVTNGQTATYNLQIAGWAGSAGVPVAFTCVGAPILCNVTPNPATLNGATAVPVTVTINTLTTTVTPMGLTWLTGSGRRRPWLLALNLLWLALIVPQARKRRIICRMALALVAMATVASLSGCGGNIPENAFGTPPGTYTFTLSASATGATTATQTITLTVN